MADDDAGASYLASLRQSSAQSSAPQAAGAAPALARNSSPSRGIHNSREARADGANSGGVDKRRSPRYKCVGSARVQEIGCTVSTWATVADISAHGCYIETATPVRIGAMLGLKIDANGFRVEATGEVRVLYPGLGMGISFAKMSEDDRERLRQLVRSVLQPSVGMSQKTAGSPSGPASDALSAVANPATALQAIQNFFQHRPVLGREEFLKIVRKSQ